MIPENRASTAPVPSALLAPDDIERTDRRVDFEMGGVAIGDTSLGVQVRHWRAWVADDTVRVLAPWPELTPITALFSAAGVSELSLAFDQLMHPTIAFVQDGLAKLYWYDTLAGAQVTTDYPGVTSPVVPGRQAGHAGAGGRHRRALHLRARWRGLVPAAAGPLHYRAVAWRAAIWRVAHRERRHGDQWPPASEPEPSAAAARGPGERRGVHGRRHGRRARAARGHRG